MAAGGTREEPVLHKRNKKGRREAGLFADISAQAEVDLST